MAVYAPGARIPPNYIESVMNPGAYDQPIAWMGQNGWEGNISLMNRLGGPSYGPSSPSATNPNYNTQQTALNNAQMTASQPGIANHTQPVPNSGGAPNAIANASANPGQYNPLGIMSPTQTNQALNASLQNQAASAQRSGYSPAQLSTLIGAIQNYMTTQAAQGWGLSPSYASTMFPGTAAYTGNAPKEALPPPWPGLGASGGSLPVQVNTGESFDPFHPAGLAGGVNGAPNYTPYNGGQYMPPQSGSLGPYGSLDANGGIANLGGGYAVPSVPLGTPGSPSNLGGAGGTTPFAPIGSYPAALPALLPPMQYWQPGMMMPGENGFGGYGYPGGGSGPLPPTNMIQYDANGNPYI
jgi:hypothetical protein